MGKKKSTSQTGPTGAALNYLTPASAAVNEAYAANKDTLASISGTLANQFGNYNANMGANLVPAQDYTSGVLGGKWLNANPFTDQIVANASDDVTDRVNAAFGLAGRTGSGAHTESMAKGLGDAILGFRANDYNQERSRMDSAVGASVGLNQAGNQNLGTLMAAGQSAAELPYLGSNMLAKNMGALWGDSTTTTQSKNFWQSLQDMAVAAAATASKAGGAG